MSSLPPFITKNTGSSPSPSEVERADVSDGLWTLAWKRFRRDWIGVASLVIVVLFVFLALASALGFVAADWSVEKGINYARPSFSAGSISQKPTNASENPILIAANGGLATSPKGNAATEINELDALAPVIAQLRGLPVLVGETQSEQTENELDPLAPIIKSLRATPSNSSVAKEAQINELDPLRETIEQFRAGKVASSGQPKTDSSSLKALDTPSIEPQTASVLLQKAAGPKRDTLVFGGDKWGRDVLAKAIKGAETSLQVGIASAFLATLIGTLLGAFAGYYGGRTDDFLNWFYSIFNAIPYILLVLAIAAVLQSKGIFTVILILGLTGWASVFRLVRAEYLKHKSRDYVRAADAIGASDTRQMFIHILPNVSHVVLVNLSLLMVGFIKSEVILSFLGFGVPVDTVSWGSMLNESQNELVLGYWWQLLAATLFMGVLVTAFSLMTDSLRDALDPKLK